MADARTLKSQRALIESGLKLINKNKEITLSDIAKEASVGRATLYRLYPNKEALVEAIALHCLEKFDQVTQPIETQAKSYMHAFELLFASLMPHTQESQFLATLEYFSELSPAIKDISDKQNEELRDSIEQGKKYGEIDKTLPTSWLVNYIDALFYTGWCHQKKQGYSPEEAAQLAFLCFKRTVSAK